jgi:hypothetical protein
VHSQRNRSQHGADRLFDQSDCRHGRARRSQGPAGEGWLFNMKVGNPAEINGLLDETAYKALTE